MPQAVQRNTAAHTAPPMMAITRSDEPSWVACAPRPLAVTLESSRGEWTELRDSAWRWRRTASCTGEEGREEGEQRDREARAGASQCRLCM